MKSLPQLLGRLHSPGRETEAGGQHTALAHESHRGEMLEGRGVLPMNRGSSVPLVLNSVPAPALALLSVLFDLSEPHL